MRSLVKLCVDSPTVSCELSALASPFSEIQVESRPLARPDDNGQADINVLLRSTNDHVRSNRQRHDVGNFIVRGRLACDVSKQLSVDCVDGVKAVRKIPRAAIVEFGGRDIDR
jgi:hypothetical protein